MKSILITLSVAAVSLASPSAYAMCGCMMRPRPPQPQGPQLIAKAPKIINKASKVILVREGDSTVMTMSNDFDGEVTEFALVVPVPTKIKRSQIRIVDGAIFDQLNQISGPQLIQHQDPDPCPAAVAGLRRMSAEASADKGSGGGRPPAPRAAKYGVKVEAHYVIGEYGIAILSAKRGSGLIEWLNKFRYDVPEGAEAVLNSYIKQDMKFFVAKVNLKKQRKLGFSFLRPIQVQYDTPKFMLPVRLGTVNADGPQELVLYALSQQGRIETTNYRTVRMPTQQTVPLYVKDQFEEFYKATFMTQTVQHDMRAVFQEYVGTPGFGAPTFTKVGVPWSKTGRRPPFGNYVMTRLHFRYDRVTFPEDLVLQETGDRIPFTTVYNVYRQASSTNCEAGKRYLEQLPRRWERQANTLAMLTRWDKGEIREKVGLSRIGAAPVPDHPHQQPAPVEQPKDERPWWRRWFGK